MTVTIVDIEGVDWQRVPETGGGQLAGGEPEIRYKYFSTGAATVPTGQLIEYDAGLVAERHHHAEGEFFYLLAGDLTIGDQVVTPGMLVHIEAGTEYGPSTTEYGCRFLRLGFAGS